MLVHALSRAKSMPGNLAQNRFLGLDLVENHTATRAAGSTARRELTILLIRHSALQNLR